MASSLVVKGKQQVFACKLVGLYTKQWVDLTNILLYWFHLVKSSDAKSKRHTV